METALLAAARPNDKDTHSSGLGERILKSGRSPEAIPVGTLLAAVPTFVVVGAWHPIANCRVGLLEKLGRTKQQTRC